MEEMIGYIDKNKISFENGLNSFDKIENEKFEFGNRSLVEENSSVIQPICAGVIITKDNKILTINKHSKATSEKSPERNKTLLYIGGHLDALDIDDSNIQTFVNGMKREILEELGFVVNDENIINPMITYTPITERSSRHFGIIFPIIIEKVIIHLSIIYSQY